MPKSYRIRTQPGVDKNIKVEVSQDFDFLEILSLKLRQEDVYTRFCADYGVVVGRVITNGGYGLPNAKVSVFVPLDSVDENDPIISTLYPYKNIGQKNEDGYRYNLLPYEQSYGGHTPTGTFPTEDDILTRQEVLEVYEKYYKYTVKTNESGDFMIIGVPLGIQKVVMDLDLSDMGCFSLRPSDLIRMGLATEGQVAGQQFRASKDLETLPQIINAVKDVDVASFWGQEDLCTIGISRVDFDLRDYGVDIKPHSVFMGSIFSNPDEDGIKESCYAKKSTGRLCEMVTSPGKILSIRQTIGVDSEGYPVLEEYKLENGGNIIDPDGTWLVEIPMNLDYVVTNEFGEQVLSNDPSVGIPTKGKYRFKIEYQNEGGLQNEFQRASYLVPNIREYVSGNDLSNPGIDSRASYAFSLDWRDYAAIDPNQGTITQYGLEMIDDAINCLDRFYEFNYNKVYTVSSHIDRFKFGFGDKRHIGIKNIDDSLCKNSTTKFPVNDGEQNSGNLFFFDLMMVIIKAIAIPLIAAMHIIFFLYDVIVTLINAIIWIINFFNLNGGGEDVEPLSYPTLNLPMISYPDCESCNCDQSFTEGKQKSSLGPNVSLLANVNDRGYYSNYTNAGNDDKNKRVRWLLSGNDGSDGSTPNLTRVPAYNLKGTQKGYSKTPNLAHKLNLLNQRERYFQSTVFNNNGGGIANIIKTTLKNNNPDGTTPSSFSDPLYDNVMILLCDPNTFSSFGAGKLITFNDIANIQDKNLTGATTNQFNTTSITGTSLYDNTQLITRPITNILPNNTVQTAYIDILSNVSAEKEYKFPSGVEYFQVITGGTVSEFSDIYWQTKNSSILYKYIRGYEQTIIYKEGGTWDAETIYPLLQIPNYRDYNIMILTRGVDPHTQRQTIEYDLSVLFGKKFGNVKVKGNYLLNIPIQPNQGSSLVTINSFKTPQPHTVSSNSTKSSQYLFFPSYTFTPDSTKFSSFTTTELYRYSSMDNRKTNFKVNNYDSHDVQTYTSPGGVSNDATTNYFIGQGDIEGASLLGMKKGGQLPSVNDINEGRLYSPVYYKDNISPLRINNSQKIVFRSDRLPTSDITDGYNNSGFVLHQNTKFAIYGIGDNGNTTFKPNVSTNTKYDDSESKDFAGTTVGGYANVIQSLSCEGMVDLDAYEGFGKSLTINPSENLNLFGQKKVVNGCYRLIKIPLATLLTGEDFELFYEWEARYRVMYAACQGAFAQMFQNNWVNGTLYMPTFNKGAIFNSDNEVSRYTYCGNPSNILTNPKGLLSSGAGPIYFNDKTNNFHYKSTKYDIAKKKFIGQEDYNILGIRIYGATNEYNIWFPTTIMDLGPRDQFTRQICFDPNFEGYLVDNLKSTSYQDTSDLLNLFVISRLANANTLEQIFGLGEASINAFFSRSGDRIDGDVAQMWSVNSEFGVVPFLSPTEVYTDNKIFVSQDTVFGTPIFGVRFESNKELRQLLTPGKTPYTQFGYPKTQEVPFYRWSLVKDPTFSAPSPATNNIFGYEDNTWDTTRRGGVNATSNDKNPDGRLFSAKYQTLDFDSATSYWKTPSKNVPNGVTVENVGHMGYTDAYSKQNPVEYDFEKFGNNSNRFLVGAPFHFYFGLRRGKTAMNRFITKYII